MHGAYRPKALVPWPATLRTAKEITTAAANSSGRCSARLSDAPCFDIIVNTDRMEDFEDVVDMPAAMAKAVHRGGVLTAVPAA